MFRHFERAAANYHKWSAKLSPGNQNPKKKILFVVNEDWFFYSHRLALAEACKRDGWEVAVTARISNHGEAIRKAGISVFPSSMQRGRISFASLWGEFKTILELRRLIRRERPTVLHLIGLKPVVFGAFAANLRRPPLTVNALTGMGYIFTSAQWDIRIIREAIKFALRFALKRKRTSLIVQNRGDAEDLISAGVVRSGQVSVIMGSGVNIEKFRACPEPEGPVVAAFVGRMLRDKGIYELVKAARELKARKTDLKILLVGNPDPGNPTSIPEDTLEGWSREGLLKWVGYRNDIAELWRSTHIAVLPSYREGMPLSLLEASATGRPLVTTDVPGCREIAEHGFNGFVVPQQDWRNLANAIEELVVSPEIRKVMGDAARQKVESVYDEKTVILQTMKIYEQAFA